MIKKLIYLFLLVPLVCYSQTLENDIDKGVVYMKHKTRYVIDSTFIKDTTVVKITPDGFVTYFVGKDSIYLGHRDSLGINLHNQKPETVQMFINELFEAIFFQMSLSRLR